VSRARGNGQATRTALAIILIVAAAGAVWYWRKPLWATFGSRDRIQEWVAGCGVWGPLASIALNVAQVLLAPVPGQFVGLVNGYLYGVWLGTLYSMIGLVLGTILAMLLARRFGRPLIERLVKPETWERWDRLARRQGPWFFFLVFLFPFLPDDVACFLIGLSPLAIPRMVVLATLGRLPGVFVSCWVGAYATGLPWWTWLPLGGVTAALAWAFWHWQAPLEATLVRLIRRLTGSGRPRAASERSAAEEVRSARP
jgi:uncharacterized membrane protein YdjX (TVP38/TMEM64 family)